ncbi:MAG TPA: hypothetical protein VN081_04845 [Dongiaceae bacterium]|nr:hypothetical protein [Dongiaceae bacterium]
MNGVPQGPALGNDDMADNQEKFLGVQTFNVQQDYDNTVDSVGVEVAENAVDTSVNQGFVKDAPNLPFCLPFLPCNKK